MGSQKLARNTVACGSGRCHHFRGAVRPGSSGSTFRASAGRSPTSDPVRDIRLIRFAALYRRFARDHHHERMLLASLSFSSRSRSPARWSWGRSFDEPFALFVAGIHLHDFAFGIGLLLIVGYLWLIQIGTTHGRTGWTADLAPLRRGRRPHARRAGVVVLPRRCYWAADRPDSIDAVALFLFGALVSVRIWADRCGAPSSHQLARLGRRARLLAAFGTTKRPAVHAGRLGARATGSTACRPPEPAPPTA